MCGNLSAQSTRSALAYSPRSRCYDLAYAVLEFRSVFGTLDFMLSDRLKLSFLASGHTPYRGHIVTASLVAWGRRGKAAENNVEATFFRVFKVPRIVMTERRNNEGVNGDREESPIHAPLGPTPSVGNGQVPPTPCDCGLRVSEATATPRRKSIVRGLCYAEEGVLFPRAFYIALATLLFVNSGRIT